MDGRHPVGAVRPDDGKVRHANPAFGTLVHEADAGDSPFITWKTPTDCIEQARVDLVDDLEVPGEHHLKPCHRPILQRFGKESVVGVGQRPLGNVPGRVPPKTLFVEQYAHELGHGDRRVGVVELDGDPWRIASISSSKTVRSSVNSNFWLINQLVCILPQVFLSDGQCTPCRSRKAEICWRLARRSFIAVSRARVSSRQAFSV